MKIQSAWMRPAVRSFLAGVAIATAAAAAHAQDYRQVAPKEPPAHPPQAPIAPAPPYTPARPAANQKLIPELIGLELVDSESKVVRNGVKQYGIVVASGLPMLDRSEIKNRLARFLGKPLYTNDLQKISQTIVEWCRTHDFPLAEAIFPEQDISTGTVQVVVTIFKLGHVRVAGNHWFRSHIFTDEMQLEPGDPFDFSVLKADLDQLNRNAFHQVTAVLERSNTPGDTDLLLNVQDRLPLRVYGSYDNEGLPVTGRDRYSVGFNWGDAFGPDQQLSYQFITTPDLWQKRDRGPGQNNDPRFEAQSANYVIPVPWGDTITVFGTYVEQVPKVDTNFGQVGRSAQASFRYDKPLPSIGDYSEQVHVGFDFKRSNNNLEFGGSEVSSISTDIEQFLLIYDSAMPDDYGQTALDNQLVYSPGGLARSNTTAVFVASGTNGAKANYVYDNLQVTRLTKLPWNMSAMLRLNGQWASTELLPSEQLGAGGDGSVRGYTTHTANGSEGGLGSFELRSPPYSPSHTFGWDLGEQGQLLAFYDGGIVREFYEQKGQAKYAGLQGTGVGVRFGVGRFLDVHFDYGWQLAKAPGADKLGNLADVSVTFGY
ncbi:MAG TPA: ShlB/FhaC/HecB family hemolysin secretion/activation protein [Rhizomicrobium sp.]|nr:ShlB/FhaC/HecB family hemolysin secretion/activation protein [Rhizomicrobium sp.]